MSASWVLSASGTRSSVAAACSTSTHAPPRSCVPVLQRLQSKPAQGSAAVACRPSRVARGRQAVVCMAHPRRVARVASQIQREVGDMFVSDPVIQAAICPERKLGDDTLSAVASITNTYVSNDLQVVKVYVSVYSDEYGKRVAMNNLQRLQPYVRRMIGQRVRLRLTPEVRFVYDDSEEEADLVARVIGREDVERYRAEIEDEMLTKAGAKKSAGSAAEAGADADAAEAAGEGEEEYEEDEEEWDEDEEFDDPDERPQEFPDPFAELFVGEENGKGGKGKGGRRQQGQGQWQVRKPQPPPKPEAAEAQPAEEAPAR
ncbi:hypothetical protein HYH03_016050 [Edaphochlamys debaryana]|uniref:Ribosome-binding factor A n=1 Tax=Edaphochlamys debaryana TaxID=47281 RepID=A0A835XKN2_9CHLO|nr:hypothetical protein HYH03_016050 [Edaphochlamys debaryana]|eukprot:KAG2485160.1 hypothetical protein HYH03_016050 [Edaphochlamys debaryana]